MWIFKLAVLLDESALASVAGSHDRSRRKIYEWDTFDYDEYAYEYLQMLKMDLALTQ